MTKSGHSPRYSVVSERIYQTLNLVCRIAQCDDPAALVRAHKAVMWLADQDEDQAQIKNGLGFSKSDTKSGRNLAKIPTRQVVLSTILGPWAVVLARKYRRQLPHRLLVDQPKKPSPKI
jgi:hypothetical protein